MKYYEKRVVDGCCPGCRDEGAVQPGHFECDMRTSLRYFAAGWTLWAEGRDEQGWFAEMRAPVVGARIAKYNGAYARFARAIERNSFDILPAAKHLMRRARKTHRHSEASYAGWVNAIPQTETEARSLVVIAWGALSTSGDGRG